MVKIVIKPRIKANYVKFYSLRDIYSVSVKKSKIEEIEAIFLSFQKFLQS